MQASWCSVKGLSFTKINTSNLVRPETVAQLCTIYQLKEVTTCHLCSLEFNSNEHQNITMVKTRLLDSSIPMAQFRHHTETCFKWMISLGMHIILIAFLRI